MQKGQHRRNCIDADLWEALNNNRKYWGETPSDVLRRLMQKEGYIPPPETARKPMKWLRLRKEIRAKMSEHSIRTLGQLARLTLKDLEREFGLASQDIYRIQDLLEARDLCLGMNLSEEQVAPEECGRD